MTTGTCFSLAALREIINRGGEKVAPREVDELLLEHPAVAEAVTFAVAHATLGEDVASAIVLRPHAAATAKDIRQFAIGRIADFKVPRQVLIVREIPKGPTGKVQRIGLAAKLGLATEHCQPRDFVAPRTALEKVLAKHWAEILQVEQISIHDDFFASGGDSLLATDVLSHVYDITQVELDVFAVFRDADGCGGGTSSRTIDSCRPNASTFISHCPRAPGKWNSDSFHCAGTIMEATASAA